MRFETTRSLLLACAASAAVLTAATSGPAGTLRVDAKSKAEGEDGSIRAPFKTIGAADGGPVGSRIDVQAFIHGDFDGDGRRDLPGAVCRETTALNHCFPAVRS